MHWECVPGCGRSKVESALHCGGQAEYLHDLTHNRCSAVIAAILVILIQDVIQCRKTELVIFENVHFDTKTIHCFDYNAYINFLIY